MLVIRELSPSLNVQSDLIRAKLFAWHCIFYYVNLKRTFSDSLFFSFLNLKMVSWRPRNVVRCYRLFYLVYVYQNPCLDEELATKRNFFEKLPKHKKVLNIWSSRDISIYRRVNIVKTLAISKLTFICRVLDTPKGFTDEVNNIIFDYIWKYKDPKLKKNDYSQK